MSIYPRTEYEMSQEDLDTLMAAMKPVPYMVIGGIPPASQQENANRAWAVLGKKMGFDPMSVRPFEGKGPRSFTAVPSETDEARTARIAVEQTERDEREVSALEADIAAAQMRIQAIKNRNGRLS